MIEWLVLWIALSLTFIFVIASPPPIKRMRNETYSDLVFWIFMLWCMVAMIVGMKYA